MTRRIHPNNGHQAIESDRGDLPGIPAAERAVLFVEPRVLNGPQAAAYIGVSYRVLLYYVNNRKIPRLQFPAFSGEDEGQLRKILVDRRDLDAFLDHAPRTRVIEENL